MDALKRHSIQVSVKAVGEKADDAPHGWIEGIANAPVVDRYEEVVLPDAIMASVGEFMKNPILSFGHDISGNQPFGLPAGKVLSLKLDDKKNSIFRAAWAPTDEAQKVRLLYQGGFMNGFSIQFIPKGRREPNKEDLLRWPNARVIITDIDLLEIACAVVPVNQDSLVTAAKSFQPSARPKGVASTGGSTVKLHLDEAMKGKLKKFHKAYEEHVKNLTPVAEALDELRQHSEAEPSGDGSDPKELAHKLGVHCALAHRSMKALRAAHKDLAESMGEHVDEDPEDEPAGGEGGESEPEEAKAFLKGLDEVLA